MASLTQVSPHSQEPTHYLIIRLRDASLESLLILHCSTASRPLPAATHSVVSPAHKTAHVTPSMPAPVYLPRYVYKIVDSEPPSPIPEVFPPSELDKADGFIHLSTASQVSHGDKAQELCSQRLFTTHS